MVYSSSKRGQYAKSITNQAQGGGSKKAGFPYQVGRQSGSSVAIGTCNPGNGQACCNLTKYMTYPFPLANFSRPVGTLNSANYRRFRVV
jgi:hypothetical protein